MRTLPGFSAPPAVARLVMAVALAGLLLNLLLQQFANEESGRLQMVLQQSQLHLPGLFLQLLKVGG